MREQLNIETFTNKKENNKAGAEQGSVYVKEREQFHNNVTAHNKADAYLSDNSTPPVILSDKAKEYA